jgi:hypothetical protein
MVCIHALPDQVTLLRRATTLPRVLWLRTPPPSMGGLRCCYVAHSSGPCLPAQEGFGAVMQPTAPDPPPSIGGLRCCHTSHGFGPCLSAQEGSGTATHPMAPRVLWATRIKNSLGCKTRPTCYRGMSTCYQSGPSSWVCKTCGMRHIKC